MAMSLPEGESRARVGQEETPSSFHITILASFTTGCFISYRSTAFRMASLSCIQPTIRPSAHVPLQAALFASPHVALTTRIHACL
jgi:hypothetical protein